MRKVVKTRTEQMQAGASNCKAVMTLTLPELADELTRSQVKSQPLRRGLRYTIAMVSPVQS